MTDCKTYPGEACLTQHRPVCATLTIKHHKVKRAKGQKRIRTWKLKDEEVRSRYQIALEGALAESDSTWTDLAREVKRAGEEICGVTSGRRGREREAWWWNDNVQSCILEKKVAFKQWQRSGTATDKYLYNCANKRAKRAVAAAKSESWSELAESFRERGGQDKIFKMAKQAKKDKKDIVGCWI